MAPDSSRGQAGQAQAGLRATFVGMAQEWIASFGRAAVTRPVLGDIGSADLYQYSYLGT